MTNPIPLYGGMEAILVMKPMIIILLQQPKPSILKSVIAMVRASHLCAWKKFIESLRVWCIVISVTKQLQLWVIHTIIVVSAMAMTTIYATSALTKVVIVRTLDIICSKLTLRWSARFKNGTPVLKALVPERSHELRNEFCNLNSYRPEAFHSPRHPQFVTTELSKSTAEANDEGLERRRSWSQRRCRGQDADAITPCQDFELTIIANAINSAFVVGTQGCLQWGRKSRASFMPGSPGAYDLISAEFAGLLIQCTRVFRRPFSVHFRPA
jgi:hypothetical protein